MNLSFHGKSIPPQEEINRLVSLFNAGRIAEVITQASETVKRFPQHGLSWKILGTALIHTGKVNEALAPFQHAAELVPGEFDVHYNLGFIHQQLGQLEPAAASYERTLKLNPDLGSALSNLGIVYQDLGRLKDAMFCFQNTLRINPDNPIGHSNLGNVLRSLGQFDQAIASYQRALAMDNSLAGVHCNLGSVLKECGRVGESIAFHQRALELEPQLVEAHINLGNTLCCLKKYEEALACLNTALSINPRNAEAYNNRGLVFQAQELHTEAENDFRSAFTINPNYAEAYFNLGISMRQIWKLEEATEAYQRALQIRPNYPEAFSNLLYLHAFTRNVSPEHECRLAADWEKTILSDVERSNAHQRRSHLNAALQTSSRPDKRIRVGFVSAQIGQHPVAEFLEPLLEQFDRSRLHVSLYPTSLRTDERAKRLTKLADATSTLVGVPDAVAAEQIRADNIDVLIDTTGHMKDCRLGIFAHRAAPVQCHYIGYHGTTGLTEMDWFIADETLLPAYCDSHFRERLWRLPRLRLAYRGDTTLPDSQWSPQSNGTVCLGSFNNLTKVRGETLALWGKVMQAVPHSTLLLKDANITDPQSRNRIRNELRPFGIEPDRITFADPVPNWKAHMLMYDKIDIALDAIPLNSETTAFDALWMGAPLVALEGNWMGGRMSSTILKSLGKKEWVAQNNDEYVSIVRALANDVAARTSMRFSQRQLMQCSPLCDASGLAKCLESAFQEMLARAPFHHGG